MVNKYNIGFESTGQEVSIDQLPLKGNIPSWLKGVLYRNGPGTFNVGEHKYRHWFDGLAMLHRFAIKNGQVGYANKYLVTKAFKEAQQTGKISYSEFATDPCRSLFGRLTAVFNQKITDSAKVSLGKIAGRYLAYGETPMQIEFDSETLDTLGVFKYETKYKQHVTTVHPHYDARDNMTYNLVTRFSKTSHYRINQVASDGNIKTVSEVPVKKPAYLHSFGMSQRYFIIAEFPLVVNPLSLLFQIRPFIENYRWQPKQGTRFFVFDRSSGELAFTATTDAFFAFHHLNAFEDKNELVIDINAYDDAEIINSFYLHRLEEGSKKMPPGRLLRYRLDLTTKNISKQVLSNAVIELAGFDYERNNMNGNYRYVYGVGINQKQPESFFNQLVKIDVTDGSSKYWFTQGQYPGEPVFVGNPQRKNEDDGILLSVVLDSISGNSFLLILNAEDLTELGRAEVPHPVLFGYHGRFFEQ